MSKPALDVSTEKSRQFLTDFLGQPPVEPKPRDAGAAEPNPDPQAESAPEQPQPSKPKETAAKAPAAPRVTDDSQEKPKAAAPAKKPKASKPAPVEPEEEPAEVAEPINVGEIVERTARAVAREVGAARQPQTTPEYRIVEPEIPASERKLQTHLAELEKLYPESYGKIAAQRKGFVEKLRTYEKKWLEEHPGEDFNPDSEEHNAFYASDPMNNVSQEHLAEAITEVRVREYVAQLEAKVEASERRREVEPKAAAEAARAARSVVKAIDGGSFGTLVQPDGTLDEAAVKTAEEADPIRAPIVAHAVREVSRMSSEMHKLYSGTVRVDIEGNPLHRQLVNFGQEVERRMLAAKPSQWKDPRGRQHSKFVTSDEYWRMSPADQKHHWTFDAEDMVGFVVQEIGADATKMIEREENRFQLAAQKRGLGVKAGSKTNAGTAADSEENNEPADEKPTSPSGRGAPNMAGPKGGTVTAKESAQKSWLDGFLGKA